MLPADIEAERSVLGALLIDRDAILLVRALLEPGHFYLEKHAWIYEAVVACADAKTPPDVMTVQAQLGERLAAVGGIVELVNLGLATPTAVHCEYYARIVRRHAVARRIIQAGGRIAARGYEAGDEAELLADAQAQLNRVHVAGGEAALRHIGETVAELVIDFGRNDVGPGLPTGLTDYDNLTGGLHGSEFILCAARPGVGKTALAGQLALNAHPAGAVLVFSLEMSRREIVQRLLSNTTGIPFDIIRDRRWGDDELHALMQGFAQLDALPIYIHDYSQREAKTVDALRLEVLRHLQQHDLPALILVDYVQLLQGSSTYRGQRHQELAEVSRVLKDLAKELDRPVVVLAQLNRDADDHATPRLSDLAESSAFEKDADVIWFLTKDESAAGKEPHQSIQINLTVAKNRNGPTGNLQLLFDRARQRFGNLNRYHVPTGY